MVRAAECLFLDGHAESLLAWNVEDGGVDAQGKYLAAPAGLSEFSVSLTGLWTSEAPSTSEDASIKKWRNYYGCSPATYVQTPNSLSSNLRLTAPRLH